MLVQQGPEHVRRVALGQESVVVLAQRDVAGMPCGGDGVSARHRAKVGVVTGGVGLAAGSVGTSRAGPEYTDLSSRRTAAARQAHRCAAGPAGHEQATLTCRLATAGSMRALPGPGSRAAAAVGSAMRFSSIFERLRGSLTPFPEDGDRRADPVRAVGGGLPQHCPIAAVRSLQSRHREQPGRDRFLQRGWPESSDGGGRSTGARQSADSETGIVRRSQ